MGFNINYFKNLKTSKERYEYALKNLNLLGKGSSRVAFLLPNTKYVLKLAVPIEPLIEEKGIAQNKAETELVSLEVKDIITRIYYYASDYSWMLVEPARTLKKKITTEQNDEFQMITGFSFDELYFFLKQIERKLFNSIGDVIVNLNSIEDRLQEFFFHKEEYIKELHYSFGLDLLSVNLNSYKSLLSNKYIIAIDQLLANGHFPGDIDSSEQWGITAKGNLVLLDYGLTNNVAKRYY